MHNVATLDSRLCVRLCSSSACPEGDEAVGQTRVERSGRRQREEGDQTGIIGSVGDEEVGQNRAVSDSDGRWMLFAAPRVGGGGWRSVEALA